MWLEGWNKCLEAATFEGSESLRQLFSAKCRCRWVVAAASPQMRCSQSANTCSCLTGTLKHPETKSLLKLIAIYCNPVCSTAFHTLASHRGATIRFPKSSVRGSLVFCLRRFQSRGVEGGPWAHSLKWWGPRRIKGSGEGGGGEITAEGPIWIFAARRRTSFTMQAAHSNTWFWFLVSLSSLGAPPPLPNESTRS